jgi:hypothetical protein
MISVKVAIAVSVVGIGASTFGVGAYVSTHPGEPIESPQEVARLPVQTRFEFAPATSIVAARSTEAKVLMLEPVLIYGRSSVLDGPKSYTTRD